MTDTTMKDLQTKAQETYPAQHEDQSYNDPFGSMRAFENAQRIAKALTSSSLVPKEFQGNQNLGNAIIAMDMAQRTGAGVLAVMQSLDIIHGRPSWRATFVIAAINTSGRFSPLRYEFVGTEGKDDWGCRAVADDAAGNRCEGPLVNIAMAKLEGWHGRQGSKWKTMPEVMLRYRAATFFGRQFAPEILLGMRTSDEMDDIVELERDQSGVFTAVERVEETANKTNVEIGEKEPEPTRQETAEQESEQGQEWPRREADPETGEEMLVDSSGAIWDPEQHSANQSVNANGTFRAKRNIRRRPGADEKPAEDLPKRAPNGQETAEARRTPPADDQDFV